MYYEKTGVGLRLAVNSISDCSKGKSIVEFDGKDAGIDVGLASALTVADPDCVSFAGNILVITSDPLGIHSSRCRARSTRSPC